MNKTETVSDATFGGIMSSEDKKKIAKSIATLYGGDDVGIKFTSVAITDGPLNLTLVTAETDLGIVFETIVKFYSDINREYGVVDHDKERREAEERETGISYA